MVFNFKEIDFRYYKTGVVLEILLLVESIFNLMWLTIFLIKIDKANIHA